jgi:hypothetical protein
MEIRRFGNPVCVDTHLAVSRLLRRIREVTILNPFADLPIITVATEYQYHYFDHPVPIAFTPDDRVYALLSALCRVYNLDEKREAKRILQHGVLRTMLAKATLGGVSEAIVLRISCLGTWLLNLPPKELKNPSHREELAIYQRNAAQVLEEAFAEGRLAYRPFISDLLFYDSPEVKLYKEALIALALAKENLLSAANSDSFVHQSARNLAG